MSDLSPAVVEIKLDGEPVTLQCTLEAAIGINSHFGGLMTAHQRVVSGDLDAFAVIVRHGAGYEAKALPDVRNRVFRRGILGLLSPLTEYVSLLMQGGKEAGADADAGEGAGAAGSGS